MRYQSCYFYLINATILGDKYKLCETSYFILSTALTVSLASMQPFEAEARLNVI
jgi:hypothetical protein